VYTNINDWYGSNLRKVKENWIFSQFKNLVDTLKVEDMFKDGSMLFEWKD
jgi:hypothetical protein